MCELCEKAYVILLNWNNSTDTIECIKSLFDLTYVNVQLIVLDNASHDDSVENIVNYLIQHIDSGNKQFPGSYLFGDHETDSIINALSASPKETSRFPYPAVVVRNAANYGFAHAHNVVMALIKKIKAYGYVWVLNNDTIVFPDTLSALICEAKQNPKNGLIGSIVSYHERPDIVQTVGGGQFYPYFGTSRLLGKNINLFDVTTFVHNNGIKNIDYIMGVSLLIQKDVLNTVGVFCEDYFVYTEDLDYSFRAKREGWHLAVAMDSHLLHKESSSTKDKKELYYYLLARNNTLFVKKYFPMVCLISTALIFPLNLMRWTRKPKYIFHGMKGLVQGLFAAINTATNTTQL